jgi:ABC-2 type transport system ATP-binding protein
MASIKARDASIVYPLMGPDRRFAKPQDSDHIPIGGKILRGNYPGILAIDNFNIELEDGDRLGIFGHNGSGKTTLLRLLAGIYPPTHGKIEISGSTAGMFSLNLGVNKEATGLENIEFKGLMRGLTKREVAEMVPEVAAFSELGDYLHLPVKTYSSGMIMRLMFATASMLKPDILLLDEWVSAGDGAFREKANEYLSTIIETSRIVIIASQNDRRLREWSNKLVYLEAGRQKEAPDAHLARHRPDPDLLQEFRRLTNIKDYAGAYGLVDGLWPLDKDERQNLYQKGVAVHRMRKPDEAVAFFRQYLDVDPDNANVRNLMARILIKLSRTDEAFEHMANAIEISDGLVGDLEWLRLNVDNSEKAQRFDRIVAMIEAHSM